MVLDGHRNKADRFLTPVARRMIRVDPNTVSLVSLLLAMMAGIALFIGRNWFLFATFFLIGFSSYFDALDGKIAKLSKRASARGDFLDHAFDRYADLFILGGIAFSSYCDLRIGLFAIIGVLLTSYMGTQAQALGCGRNYRGWLGRADRLVILMFAPFFQIAFNYFGWSISFETVEWGIRSLSFFELIMIWFALAGNVTAIQRAIATWNELGKKK